MKDALLVILVGILAFVGGVAYGGSGGSLPAPSATLNGAAAVLDTAAEIVRPGTAPSERSEQAVSADIDYRATARAMAREIMAETAVPESTPTPQPTATEAAPTATAVIGIVARRIEAMVATPVPAVFEQPPPPPTPQIIQAGGLPDALPYAQQEQWQCKAMEIIGTLPNLPEPQLSNCLTYLED